MTMLVARRSARASETKVTISAKSKNILFTAGFFRYYSLNKTNAQYVRLGYDAEKNEIGLDFLGSDDANEEAMKMSYSKIGSSASCAAKSLLTVFSLDITQIAGIYRPSAIVGPINIPGFSEKGFILKVNKREL